MLQTGRSFVALAKAFQSAPEVWAELNRLNAQISRLPLERNDGSTIKAVENFALTPAAGAAPITPEGLAQLNSLVADASALVDSVGTDAQLDTYREQMTAYVASRKACTLYGQRPRRLRVSLTRQISSATGQIWSARSSDWAYCLDQLDIPRGARWDEAVEAALKASPCLLVILSPASVNSQNVKDEVSYALDDKKRIISVLWRKCDIPLRLRRFQYIDFTADYDSGLKELRKALRNR